MLGSDVVVAMLKEYGVRHIFGLPGDTGMSLYQSLSRAEELTHVLCRDERHGGYMAEAYARVSGRPGLCEVPSGGGFTYLVPAVAEAEGSSVPLISLASDVTTTSDEKAALTAIDQVAVLKPLTRFCNRLTDPVLIPHMFRKAFRLATSGRPGPAHLVFPENILTAEVNQEIVVSDIYAESVCRIFPSFRFRADSGSIEEAAELIAAAARPLIIAGGGVLLSGAHEALSALSKRYALPVVTTINGKGSVAEIGPLAFGVMGTNGAKFSTNLSVQEADLVLAVGTRLNSSITMGNSLINPGAKIIHVDIDPAQLGNTVRSDLTVQSDALLFFKDLKEALKERFSFPRLPSDWIVQKAKEIELEFEQMDKHLSSQRSLSMHPAQVVRTLEKLLPVESIVVSDAGYSTPYTAAFYRIRAAGRKFIDPRAQGALGYALPASIGVKLAMPEVPVVGLFGDGSLGMSIGELETVSRLQLPLILLHFNNGCFGWIQNLQKIYCDGNYFSSSFDPSTDYVAMAAACGLDAVQVGNVEQLEAALHSALEASKAVFIEIKIPSGKELTPLVAPWLADEALSPDKRNKKGY